MKKFLLLSALILCGCSQKPDVVTGSWRYTEESIRCQNTIRLAEFNRGACFRDYWNEYRKCVGVIATGTGCILMKGLKGPPWCYPENCKSLHEKAPDLYSLWP